MPVQFGNFTRRLSQFMGIHSPNERKQQSIKKSDRLLTALLDKTQVAIAPKLDTSSVKSAVRMPIPSSPQKSTFKKELERTAVLMDDPLGVKPKSTQTAQELGGKNREANSKPPSQTPEARGHTPPPAQEPTSAIATDKIADLRKDKKKSIPKDHLPSFSAAIGSLVQDTLYRTNEQQFTTGAPIDLPGLSSELLSLQDLKPKALKEAGLYAGPKLEGEGNFCFNLEKGGKAHQLLAKIPAVNELLSEQGSFLVDTSTSSFTEKVTFQLLE